MAMAVIRPAAAAVAVTVGDPAGIGPEIVAKLFAAGVPVPALAIGDAGALQGAVAALKLPLEVVAVSKIVDARFGAGVLPVLATSDIGAGVAIGRVDARCGKAAYDAVVAGRTCGFARRDQGAIVTAPIHKEALAAAGMHVSRPYRNAGRPRPVSTTSP